MLAQEFVGVGLKIGPRQGYRKLFITVLNRKSFSHLTLRAEGNCNTPVESISLCFSLKFSVAKEQRGRRSINGTQMGPSSSVFVTSRCSVNPYGRWEMGRALALRIWIFLLPCGMSSCAERDRGSDINTMRYSRNRGIET
ncbi:unnamed protein product [Leuciscus chuanchicus]